MSYVNQPTVFIIFGGTGDLARRKLMPSLYNLFRQNRLPATFEIISFARRENTDETYKNYVRESILALFPDLYDEFYWEKFSEKIHYEQGDFNNADSFEKLAEKINFVDNSLGICTHKIFYLAISPDQYTMALNGIQNTKLKLICQNVKDTKVVLEKPFGKNLKDFENINNQVKASFSPEQIFRIDHYLAKESVENLLYFRAANPIFFNDWNDENIESIEIKAYESLGVEARGKYYDEYGQLKDMVQFHLLQILALIVMDLPGEFVSGIINVKKTEILKNIIIEDFEKDIVRGQYTSGIIDAKTVVSYLDESGINENSETETFVKLKLKLDLPKWKRTQIIITSGKRLPEKYTKVIVTFKKKSIVKEIDSANSLEFIIQPNEGISVGFKVKKPGTKNLEVVRMNFAYSENFKLLSADAYEKVVLDIISSAHANFISEGELRASFEFIGKITSYWSSVKNLQHYPAGSLSLV